MPVLRNGYSCGYLSINSILGTDVSLPCRVQMKIPKFGFLASEYFSEDLEPGTELPLPLWAAEVLCRPSGPRQPNNIAILQLPEFFKDALWEVLEDDPKAADLRRFHTHYYEAGFHCSMLRHKEVETHLEMIVEVLKQRVLCVGEDTIENLDSLEALERTLFEDWNAELTKLQKWMMPLIKSQKETVQESSLCALKNVADIVDGAGNSKMLELEPGRMTMTTMYVENDEHSDLSNINTEDVEALVAGCPQVWFEKSNDMDSNDKMMSIPSLPDSDQEATQQE